MTHPSLMPDTYLPELGKGSGYFLLAFRGIAFGGARCNCLNRFYENVFGPAGETVLTEIRILARYLGNVGHRRIDRSKRRVSVKDTELKLGDLEVATLEAVWSAGALDARQLHARIGEQRGISLQTVQSTLERLFKKSVLVREKVSHAYVYSPRLSREEVMAKLVSDTLSRFGDNRADGLLAAFSGLTETADEDVLATLEAMITERKAKRVDGGAA